MTPTVAAPASSRHLANLDVPSVMAKAHLPNRETPWRARVGGAVERCFSLAGLTLKEAADLIGRDRAQVGKWIAGTERPQIDAIFAVESLRCPLVIALSELAGAGVEVETTIRVKKSA